MGKSCDVILWFPVCCIRDLHMKLGERQVQVAFLPFTDKYPSNSLG